MDNEKFKPGHVLYEVVVGAFRASGTTFEVWCRENGVASNNARNALLGANVGPSGKRLLGKLVDAAGRDVVTVSYRTRMERHVAEIARTTGNPGDGVAA